MSVKCMDCSREITHQEAQEIRVALHCDWIELFEIEKAHVVGLRSEHELGSIVEYMEASWSETGRLALDDLMVCSPRTAEMERELKLLKAEWEAIEERS